MSESYEQKRIEGQDWGEPLDTMEDFLTSEKIDVWEQEYLQWLAGLEDQEEIDRQCRFWMLWKRAGNVFQSAAISRRVEMTRERDRQVVQSGEQLFRPEVRYRMQQERQAFWERHK